MKKSNKLLVFCLFIFTFCCAFVLLSDKTYTKVINKDKTVYIEDIRKEDFIESGSYLTTDENGMHWISKNSSYGRYYTDIYNVCFSYQGDCVENDIFSAVSDETGLLVPDVPEPGGYFKGYNGWRLKEVKADVSSYLPNLYMKYIFIFVPAKENVTLEPEFDANNYSLSSGTCSDNSKLKYDWYQETEVKLKTDFDTSTDSLTQSFNNNGMYVYAGHYFNRPFEFEFEAEAGDVLSFDISTIRFVSAYGEEEAMEDSEVTITITNGDSETTTKYNTSIYFTHVSLDIKKSGIQKMSLTINSTGSTNIKNVKLLRHINSAQALDKSELENNDNIYYTCSCGNEVVFDGSTTYVDMRDNNSNGDSEDSDNNGNNSNGTDAGNDSSTDDDSDDKDIPNTGAFLSIGLIVLLMFAGIVIWNYADKKRKFSKM